MFFVYDHPKPPAVFRSPLHTLQILVNEIFNFLEASWADEYSAMSVPLRAY